MRIKPSSPAGTPQFMTERVVPRGVAKAVQFMRANLMVRLDIAALCRRSFSPPSVLWILLLTPFA